jgi:opacity protein-like surface antigen
MKTIRTFVSLFAALLAMGTAAAQNAHYAPPGPSSFDTNHEVSFAVPKNHGANLFLTVGATWLGADDTKNKNSVDLYGGTIAFGWRIDKHNKIQIEAGVLGGSQNESRYYSIDYITSMELFTYSFCIPLDRKGVCELRLSPSLGAAYIFTDYNDPHWWMTDSDITLAAGAGIGLTIHTGRRFQLDLGYRYMRVGKTTYNWGDMGALNTNSLTFSAGWKF